MDYIKSLCLLVVFALFSVGVCEKRENISAQQSARALFANFIPCGLTGDVSCFLDTADTLVAEKRTEILAQADLEAFKASPSSRSESQVSEDSPSQLAKAIQHIISELTDIFKDGLSGIFKSAREGDDEDALETEEDKTSLGEARKKKKGKIAKLVGLIKLIIFGIVLAVKITLLLKAFSAALQVKFFLVALAGLILNAARFYLDLKKGHQPQKVIYYEHAQHQHHYEGGEEDWDGGSSSSGGYWGRSYDEEAEKAGTSQGAGAHNLAYAKQRPAYQQTEENSNSWF